MNLLKKYSIVLVLLVCISSVHAQSYKLVRQVIGSAGGVVPLTLGTNTNTYVVSFTVGEAVIGTTTTRQINNAATYLTQGFQQPLPKNSKTTTNDVLKITADTIMPFCKTYLESGKVSVKVVFNNKVITDFCRFDWTAINVKDTVASINYPKLDQSVACTLKIHINYKDSIRNTIYVNDTTYIINLNPVINDCLLTTPWTGFTPNGDGKNEFFYIENIDAYPVNTVTIFNRWGAKVWSGQNYENNEDKAWTGGDLPASTYFYLIEIQVQGELKTRSGWVQLVK